MNTQTIIRSCGVSLTLGSDDVLEIGFANSLNQTVIADVFLASTDFVVFIIFLLSPDSICLKLKIISTLSTC